MATAKAKAKKDVRVGSQAHTKKADQMGIRDRVDRPLKIVFLGAGSGFFRDLFKDVLNIPGADRGEMALVDIDPKGLAASHRFGTMIAERMDKPGWKVTATTDRRKVLKGADYVINCIEVSGLECVKFDYRIPMKYGVDQCIGDTIGPGGLMKAMRTVPVWLDVLRDIEELCPAAWILNYTNPMSIMCLAAARASTAKVVGLCHSVQGSSHAAAKYAQVSYPEMKWRCGGINHLAWFTELSHHGQDLYPGIRRRVESEKDFIQCDPVRLDVMMHLGYYVTESSGHFSEYLPYYRKRPELIQRHCGEGYNGGSGFYANEWPKWRRGRAKQYLEYASGKREFGTERSWEYASFIIEAMETHQPFVAYCSVPNRGLIDNLPQDGVVEVATLIDANGATPTRFGRLPAQCAALCDWHMRMYDLAADACIQRSLELATMALMLDPLTAAACSPGEIRKMANELFRAEKKFLTGFK
jgi:alpha-galactosidase